MTTQDMHIEIDLELQKINSQSTKNILPQEKDWFLNNEVIDYLNQKVHPTSNIKKLGFEDNAKRVEDIKDLIRHKSLVVKTNSRGKQYVTLPSDYFGYIRFDVNSFKKCSNLNIVPTNKVTYVNTVKIDLPDTLVGNFSVYITKNNNTVYLFNSNNLPSGYLINDTYPRQKTLLIKALKIVMLKNLKALLSPDAELYWEKIDYDYKALTFTIVSPVPFTHTGVTISGVTATTIVTDVTYSISDTPLKAKLRVVDDEYLTDIENSSLSNSKAESPVGVLREGVLELSPMRNAIYGSVDITYICIPNIIDLLLNSDLNVSDRVAKEIVATTIRKLKGIVESQDYQVYAQENILTE